MWKTSKNQRKAKVDSSLSKSSVSKRPHGYATVLFQKIHSGERFRKVAFSEIVFILDMKTIAISVTKQLPFHVWMGLSLVLLSCTTSKEKHRCSNERDHTYISIWASFFLFSLSTYSSEREKRKKDAHILIYYTISLLSVVSLTLSIEIQVQMINQLFETDPPFLFNLDGKCSFCVFCVQSYKIKSNL